EVISHTRHGTAVSVASQGQYARTGKSVLLVLTDYGRIRTMLTSVTVADECEPVTEGLTMTTLWRRTVLVVAMVIGGLTVLLMACTGMNLAGKQLAEDMARDWHRHW